MNVSLIDIDSYLPNLALMKLSMYHKSNGDSATLGSMDADKTYVSCIFPQNAPQAKGIAALINSDKIQYGGTGISTSIKLPHNIEFTKPDYSLYTVCNKCGKVWGRGCRCKNKQPGPMWYSMGFSSRGCIRDCDFCIVREKEGPIQKWDDISNFHDPSFDTVMLMDNNLLSCDNWRYTLDYMQSIAYIHKLREGFKPHSIHESKHIFVTTNSRLAYASKLYDNTIYGEGNYFSITSTDILIGTLLWLRKPEKMIDSTKKRLLSSVYAMIEPNDELLKRFVNEIEKLNRRNDISQDDYILLRDSHTARKILSEETLGDPNAFTPKTAMDILEEMKETTERQLHVEREEHERVRRTLELENIKIKEDEKNKLLREKEEQAKIREKIENENKRIREEEKKKLLKESKEHAETKNKLEKIDKRVNTIAIISAGITIGLCVIILFSSIFLLNGLIQIIAGIVSVIGFVLSILGITVVPIKDKYKILIKRIIGFN